MPKKLVIRKKNGKKPTKRIRMTKLHPVKIDKTPRDPNKKPTKDIAKPTTKKKTGKKKQKSLS